MPDNINILATAMPDKVHAATTRSLYNRKLQTSLGTLIQIAGNGLKRDTTRIQEETQSLDTNRAIHPAWYDAHHRLKAAMKAQNAKLVEQMLDYIGASVATLPYPVQGQISVDTIDCHPWQSEVLAGFRSENFGINRAGELVPVEQTTLLEHGNYALEAAALIGTCAPAMADEIDQLVNGLCLFGGIKAERGMVGGSDVRVFGEIYLRINDFDDHHMAYYAEHLVHECSHLYLHALMAHDPLILNDRTERYPAPIRPDLRPMYGIYHATFVLSRMVWVFAAISKSQNQPEFEAALNLFRKQFQKGRDVVLTHGKMTEAGRAIVESYTPFLEKSL